MRGPPIPLFLLFLLEDVLHLLQGHMKPLGDYRRVYEPLEGKNGLLYALSDAVFLAFYVAQPAFVPPAELRNTISGFAGKVSELGLSDP